MLALIVANYIALAFLAAFRPACLDNHARIYSATLTALAAFQCGFSFAVLPD